MARERTPGRTTTQGLSEATLSPKSIGFTNAMKFLIRRVNRRSLANSGMLESKHYPYTVEDVVPCVVLPSCGPQTSLD